MLMFVATITRRMTLLRSLNWRKLELNDDAVPTLFSFCTPPKCRKFSEARANKHHAIIDELLPGPSSLSSPKPSTKNTKVKSGEN